MELIEERSCWRESGCIVDEPGCTVVYTLETSKKSRQMTVKKTVTIIQARSDESVHESFAGILSQIFSDATDVIDEVETRRSYFGHMGRHR